MNAISTLSVLHDRTLLNIDIDWQAARATIRLKGPGDSVEAWVAEGLRELHVPRFDNWGRSNSVNVLAEVESPSKGTRCWHLEMQSGDTIRISAVDISRWKDDDAT